MMWKHFPHAMNNTMQLREATEALKYHPEGMVVWVTTDSQYVRKGALKWMPKQKRNGWKNPKK
jgi:ribonuclease HI